MAEIDGAVSSPAEGQASATPPDSATQPDTGSAGHDSGKSTDLDSIVAAAIKDASPEDAVPPARQGRKPRTPKSDQAAPSEPQTAATGPETDKQEEADKPKPDAASKFPGQWDAKTREAVSKLDPETQQLVVKLAKDAEVALTRKTQEYAEDRRYSQAVKGLITDEHRRQLQAAGLDEVGGIKRLLQYQDYALKEPKRYVRWFTSQAKIDPRELFPELAAGQPAPAASGNPAPQPSPAASPQPRPQPPEPDPHINHLLGRFDRLEQWAQQQEQARVEYVETQALNEVARFRDAKDANGNPLRPYFDRVEEGMARMLQSDPVLVEKKATDPVGALQDAYEAAVMLNPELRQAVLDSEVQKRSAAQRRTADIEKARAARSPVTGTAPISASGRPGSIDDAVTAAMRQAGVV